LPHAPDAELADWLTTNCNLPIIRAKREWAIAYPPPYAFDDNGSLEIPATTEVVLALKSIGSEQAGVLSCTVGSASVSLELAETTQHFIELSEPKGTANKALHLAWDCAHVITLVAKPYPESPIEPSVALEFELDGTKESAALHQTRARQLLSDTRNAKARLTAIHAHSALQGELRQRKFGTLDWTTEALTVNSREFFEHPQSAARSGFDRAHQSDATRQVTGYCAGLWSVWTLFLLREWTKSNPPSAHFEFKANYVPGSSGSARLRARLLPGNDNPWECWTIKR